MARTRNPIEKVIGSAVDTAKKVVDVITPGSSARPSSRRSRSSAPIPKSVPPRVKETAKAAGTAASKTASTAKHAAGSAARTAKAGAARTASSARKTATKTTSRTKVGAKRTKATATRQASAAASTASSSGPGQGVAYEQWTRAQLYERAQELDIEGRSTMNKKQLIAALRDGS